MGFRIADIGHPEDESISIHDPVTGKKFILADTGNGGATAYQLLDPIYEEEDNYGEFGYHASRQEGIYAAIAWHFKRRLRSIADMTDDCVENPRHRPVWDGEMHENDTAHGGSWR